MGHTTGAMVACTITGDICRICGYDFSGIQIAAVEQSNSATAD